MRPPSTSKIQRVQTLVARRLEMSMTPHSIRARTPRVTAKARQNWTGRILGRLSMRSSLSACGSMT